MSYLKTIILFLSCLFSNFLYGQCTLSPIPQEPCSGGNGALADGTTVGNNQTFWFDGGSAVFNSINLNRGKLVICGDLTLNNISINQGTILINSGGSLTILGGGNLDLNGSVEIYNYGTLNINRNMVIQNSSNVLYNVTANSVMNFPGVSIDFNSASSTYINNGVFNIGTARFQNGIKFCLGEGGQLNANQIDVNTFNPLVVTGSANTSCVHFDNISLNNSLTAEPAVKVCQDDDANINFGSGIDVFQNCNSCADLFATLPIQLFSFDAHPVDAGVNIQWQTLSEQNTKSFFIQRSQDGVNFETVSAAIEAAGNSSILKEYDWTDRRPPAGIVYYRLEELGQDGIREQHGWAAVLVDNELGSLKILANPIQDVLAFSLPDAPEEISVSLWDAQGSLIRKARLNVPKWEISDLPAGIYIFGVFSQGQIFKKRIVKID